MKSTFFLLITSILVTSCFNDPQENDWRILYKNDKQGNALIGSKAELINAIRLGHDIKIGWGSKGKDHRIEHLSEPIWLAILDEKEVIAHLDPQILSTIDWNTLSANYRNAKMLTQEWRVAITTRGRFDAVWYDRKGDSLLKRVPQSHTMSWFARGKTVTTPALFKE